jgi:hypothetical protein
MSNTGEVLLPDFPDFEPILSCRGWNIHIPGENEVTADDPLGDQLSFDSVKMAGLIRLTSHNRYGEWIPQEVMGAQCRVNNTTPVSGSANPMKSMGDINEFYNNHLKFSRTWVTVPNQNTLPGMPVEFPTGLSALQREDWLKQQESVTHVWRATYAPIYDPLNKILEDSKDEEQTSETGEADHMAPEPSCTCGIYSRKDYTNLESSYRGMVVLGTMKNWGRIVQGTIGYRTQYAYPDHLWVNSKHTIFLERDSLSPESVAMSLVDAYDVPVEIGAGLEDIGRRISKYANWPDPTGTL